MALNIKQEAFCLHYAKTGNATESYKIAGYSAKTDNAIYANSNRLLKNDKVKARLKELADEFGVQGEYRALYVQAQLGKQYEKRLQDEVVRLFLALDLGLEEPVIRSIAGKIGAEELLHLKAALEMRAGEYLPLQTQLFNRRDDDVESGYLI